MGQTRRSAHIKSPPVSTLVSAEGNVFVTCPLSLQLSVPSLLLFLIFFFFLPLTFFLHLAGTSRFREQKTKNVALRVQTFRIKPTGCCCWGAGGGELVLLSEYVRGSRFTRGGKKTLLVWLPW